jgi:cytoskeleton protein RodZ
MTERTAAPATGSADSSPGTLLRAARERRGMHIAALAAAIKVAPARLEALEADDYDAMPDITFARALAQAVCRVLKVDPVPVLAQMPESLHSRLERVDEGLNAPFRDRGGRLIEGGEFAPWRYPVAWVALALLLAAAAFVWWPKAPAAPEPVPPGAEPVASAPVPAASSVALADPSPAPASDVAAAASQPPATAGTGSAATTPTAATAATTATPAAAAASAVVAPPAPRAAAASLPIFAAASTAPAAAPAPLVASGDTAVLRAVQDTWVQITDGSGKVLAARTFTAGETVPFAGPLPLRLRIGNVQGTELAFRGKPIELRGLTRDNTVTVILPAPVNTP